MTKKRVQTEEHAEGSQSRQNVPGVEAENAAREEIGRENTVPAPEGVADRADGQTAQSQTPEGRVFALEAENADLKDKLLRKQADFENFRKRILRERDEAARYANAALLSDLIGLIDDFERAIRSAEESRDFTTFHQGIGMIEKRLVEMLESRWGLKRFSSVGESFDPNRHEAVLKVEGPVDARPTVVEDYQKGYFLHERVLRPAKVKVMVPASEANKDGKAAPDPLSGDGGTRGS